VPAGATKFAFRRLPPPQLPIGRFKRAGGRSMKSVALAGLREE
jgi:hypothetical protein